MFEQLLEQLAGAFVEETMVLPCEDPKTGIRIDLIFSISSFESNAITRAHKRTVGQTQIAYASPEDLIILKLIAGRPRDIEDVRGLVIKNPSHDRNYVRDWLKQFEKALDRSLITTYDSLQDR